MTIATHWHAAPALLALTLVSCASPQPSPVAVGHPGHADTVAAPPPTLTILQTYRDFGEADAQDRPAPLPPGKEKSDAHAH